MAAPDGAPLFELGRVVATAGAAEVLGAGVPDWRLNAAGYVARHLRGDWGDVQPQDARENRHSVKHGFRILSSYEVAGERLWIITEADRSSTCILRPDEY